MTGPGRVLWDQALHHSRVSAHEPGEFVGQESFMEAGEILALARAAGVGAGTRVLDLCCGVAGPGLLVTESLRCDYLGVDASADAVALARQRAGGLPCRFLVVTVPPLPAGEFEVVLLLETMLAFADKEALLRAIAAALLPGGRFACTFEEGDPLTPAERAQMPAADTVWPVPLDDFRALLGDVGLDVRWVEEHTAAHARVAGALARRIDDDRQALAGALGPAHHADLLAAHRLWGRWLASGRVRKFALVAEKRCPQGTAT